MDLETAEELMSVSLAQCSYLTKTLAEIQERVGLEDAKTYCDAVGQILAWFLFEVFTPLGQQFPGVRDWPLQPREWTPDFARARDREAAFLSISRAVEGTERVAAQLSLEGVMREGALPDLKKWTLQCRCFVDSGLAA